MLQVKPRAQNGFHSKVHYENDFTAPMVRDKSGPKKHYQAHEYDSASDLHDYYSDEKLQNQHHQQRRYTSRKVKKSSMWTALFIIVWFMMIFYLILHAMMIFQPAGE